MKKTAYMILTLGLLLGIAGLAKSSWAATYSVTCSGDITSALNSAISSAVSGDTISIGPGSCSSGNISFLGKNIIITGAGKASTIITTDAGFINYAATDAAHSSWRVTAMTLASTGNPSHPAFMIWANQGGVFNYGWRVDHIKFDFPTSSQYIMHVYGVSWGLFDNNEINFGAGTVLNFQGIQAEEDGTLNALGGSYDLSLPLTPGTYKAVYIEDNTFLCNGGCAVVDTSNASARVAFRYNTVTGGMFYTHWTRGGVIDAGWFEIYRNTWIGTTSYGLSPNSGYPARIEGGTGLIYANKVSNYDYHNWCLDERRGDGGESNSPLLSCDGTRSWDGNFGDTSSPGWPCLGQIGRASGKTVAAIREGDKQASFPFYAWANGAQDGCLNGGACTNTIDLAATTTCFAPSTKSAYVSFTAHTSMGVGNPGYGDKDFCTGGSNQPSGCGTHTLTYTPFTYPHPLQGLIDITPPAAPTGLAVQ